MMSEGNEDDDCDEACRAYSSEDHSGHLIHNMEKFRVDSGFTDIIINVEGRQFPCHKVVLAAGSPYFHSMFSSGMEECRKKTIEIKQVDGEVFEQVLGFIYTGNVTINEGIVEDLFTQAHIFQVSPLVELCVEFYQENMKPGNCLSAMTLADVHNHTALYQFAKQFACFNFQGLVHDEELYKLSVDCIIDLLKDRRLNAPNEELVFETAVKWLEHDASNKSHRYRILETIKFPLLSKKYLIDVVSKSAHVLADDRGRELLDEGMLFHTIPSRQYLLPSFQITPRYSFPMFETAVLLGGRLQDGLSNDVECFVADSKDFISLRQLPFKKRNEFAACTIGNDIYVSGGLRSAEFWKYEAVFDTWIRGSNLVHARRRHGMAPVDDSIFVLGGFDEDNVLASVECWQMSTNRWEEVGVLVQPVENMGFVAYGKKIFLFGGKNNLEVVTDAVQCYDTITKSCMVLNRVFPANDMCLSAAVLNNHIYVVGLEGAFRFAPERESWEILPDMSCARDFVSLAVLDEKLYAFGGRRRGAKDNLYTDQVECFDTETSTWQSAGTLPMAMYAYGCVKIFLGRNVKRD